MNFSRSLLGLKSQFCHIIVVPKGYKHANKAEAPLRRGAPSQTTTIHATFCFYEVRVVLRFIHASRQKGLKLILHLRLSANSAMVKAMMLRLKQ